jgi:hypothetical protein
MALRHSAKVSRDDYARNDREGGSSRLIVRSVTRLPRMENELVKKIVWSGLLTAVGALASIVTQRTAAYVWRRVFDEEPPE